MCKRADRQILYEEQTLVSDSYLASTRIARLQPLETVQFKCACHRTAACRPTRRERRAPEAGRWAALISGGYMRAPILLCLSIIAIPAWAQTPPCSDGRTTDLVKRIFAQSVERQTAGFPQAQQIYQGIMSRIAVSVRSIRTAEIDRQIGKHYCEGVLEVRLSPQGAAMMNAPHAQAVLAQSHETRGIRVAGNAVTHEVRFTSQLTDDRKEHYIEARGHEILAQLVFQLTAKEVGDQLASKPSATDAPRQPSPSELAPKPATPVAPAQIQTATWAPSFDCAKAGNPAERLICSSKELSDADVRMASAYRQTLASSKDKDRLRKEQNAWRTGRRDVCADTRCMLGAYQDRLAELARQ